MHIADVTMFYAPASGGVRTYLEAKHRWLAERVRHSLVVPGARCHQRDEYHTVPAPRIPFGHGYRFPFLRKSWVECLVQLQPDLIEAGDPYVPGWAALEAGQRLDVPVIGFYHSDLPRLIGARVGHWSDQALERYISRFYRRFDRVLAPSQMMVDKLLRLGIDTVHLQPLGVDTRRFHPQWRDPSLKTQLGLSEETPLLIFVGRAAKEKNIPLLLRTFDKLGAKYHLLLVGPGMPRHVLPNVTVIQEYVNAEQVARYMASSDALIHAGDRETFGLVVLEAMASGLPVVGTRAGAVSELVVPGCGLLAEPNNADSLANMVRALFANCSRAMGRLARRRVEERYSWEQVLGQLMNHYRELTGEDALAAQGGRCA